MTFAPGARRNGFEAVSSSVFLDCDCAQAVAVRQAIAGSQVIADRKTSGQKMVFLMRKSLTLHLSFVLLIPAPAGFPACADVCGPGARAPAFLHSPLNRPRPQLFQSHRCARPWF